MQRDEFERIAELFFHFFKTSIPAYSDLDFRRRLGAVSIKEHGELVGELDKEIEQCYFRFFAEYFPNDVIVSEETEHVWPPSGDFWIIDPCDGTHNFLSGSSLFGTMAARVQRGVVTFSAIFLPAKKFGMESGCYIAGRNHGSWEWRRDKNHQRLRVTRIELLQESFLLFEGPSRCVDDSSLARHFKNQIQFYQKPSASSWAGVLAASGGNYPRGFDGIVTFGNSPWDMLPISLLVEEAGGKVTDHKGNPMTLDNCSDLVMSNGVIHDQILAIFRAAQKADSGIRDGGLDVSGSGGGVKPTL